jgi:UDP-N-acetylenolpyruvoylglucosamine reductase
LEKDSALAKQKKQFFIASAQIRLKRKGKLFYRDSAKAYCKIAIVRQLKQTAIHKAVGSATTRDTVDLLKRMGLPE